MAARRRAHQHSDVADPSSLAMICPHQGTRGTSAPLSGISGTGPMCPHHREGHSSSGERQIRRAEGTVMNVEVEALVRTFRRTRAVAGVDLRIGSGVFGLLGPNGAGKTTLLRTLATVSRPDSGTVRLLGRDPANPH